MTIDESIAEYTNSLPLPALVVKSDTETLNHQTVCVNERFIHEIGYTIEEIPDKNSWWVKAYPDRAYQKVVERHWELAVETYQESEGKYVEMDAEIRTKHHGAVKFRVYSEAQEFQFPGYYIVMFEKLAE